MRGNFSRLIFLDSSVSTVGDRAKVLLPSRSFSVQGNERMSITLQSFGIRRNWYNINPTNNTGYIAVGPTGASGTEVLYEFRITPGSYATFTALATAIQTSLNTAITDHSIAALNNFTATYDSISRLFTITCTKSAGNSAPPAVQIKCFAVKGPPPAVGVSLQGGFSDLHEILGGKPLRSATATGGSLTLLSGGANVEQLQSKFPASLNTLDAVYIHLPGLETGNFMSTGLESHIAEGIRLVESSLFARIPFDSSSFDEIHEVVEFVDSGGDSFQSFLTRKSLEHIEMRVTDAKGRSLANIDHTQEEEGLLSFKAVLRFDIFSPPTPPEPSHGVLHKPMHPPSVSFR